MMEEKKVHKESWGKKLRGQFLTGLAVIIPLGASILILVWLFNSIDRILQPLIRVFAHHDIRGVGFAVTVVLIYLVGVIGRNVIGRRIVRYFDGLLAKVPVFRLLYRGIRQIVDSFSNSDKNGFLQVVLVDFPRKGQKALGLVTSEIVDKNGQKWYSVLIPTAPNPMTGFLEILQESDIVRTQIPVEDAVKMIVSAGKMMPQDIQNKI